MKLQEMKNKVEVNNSIYIRLDKIKQRIGEFEGRTVEIAQKTMEIKIGNMQEILRYRKDSLRKYMSEQSYL